MGSIDQYSKDAGPRGAWHPWRAMAHPNLPGLLCAAAFCAMLVLLACWPARHSSQPPSGAPASASRVDAHATPLRGDPTWRAGRRTLAALHANRLIGPGVAAVQACIPDARWAHVGAIDCRASVASMLRVEPSSAPVDIHAARLAAQRDTAHLAARATALQRQTRVDRALLLAAAPQARDDWLDPRPSRRVDCTWPEPPAARPARDARRSPSAAAQAPIRAQSSQTRSQSPMRC